jgi:hypothetical protein
LTDDMDPTQRKWSDKKKKVILDRVV